MENMLYLDDYRWVVWDVVWDVAVRVMLIKFIGTWYLAVSAI